MTTTNITTYIGIGEVDIYMFIYRNDDSLEANLDHRYNDLPSNLPCNLYIYSIDDPDDIHNLLIEVCAHANSIGYTLELVDSIHSPYDLIEFIKDEHRQED